MTKKQLHNRIFAVRIGVYFALVAGIICQWLVMGIDIAELEVDLRMDGITLSKIAFAFVLGFLSYNKVEGDGKLDENANKDEMQGRIKNVRRVLIFGFTYGFTLSGFTEVLK